MSDRHITAACWQQIETLLDKLGVDANTVMIDWQWPDLDPDHPPRLQLRYELEEIGDRYLNSPKFLTQLQMAKAARKTFDKVEDLIAELEQSVFAAGVWRVIFRDKPAAAAKTALTVFAEKLRRRIADCEAQGSSSRDSAKKATRNACWCELAAVWEVATANVKTGRKQRYEFIRLCAPAPFKPGSDGALNRVLDRLRQTN